MPPRNYKAVNIKEKECQHQQQQQGRVYPSFVCETAQDQTTSHIQEHNLHKLHQETE